MSDRDPLDELSRALFQAAREERPRAEVRARAAELQHGATAEHRDTSHARPVAMPSAAAPELRRARGSVAAVWAGTALAVAAAALLASALSRRAAPAPALRAEQAERVPRAETPQPHTNKPASAPASEQPALARSQPDEAARPRATPVKQPPPATLSEELALLDQARSALASGDVPRALALLDRYDGKLRATHLNAEAALLRIEALSKGGHAEEARKRARHFIEIYPDSPLADRARALLGSSEGSSP